MKLKTIRLFAVASVFLLSSCNTTVNMLRNKEMPRLFPITQNRKWGFINSQGEIVIQPQFELVLPFTENLAVACLSREKCGYVDEAGKFVINPQFDRAGRFSEGLAAVTVGGKVGYIDKAGKYVVNPQFATGSSDPSFFMSLTFNTFSEGMAQVKVGDKIGFINKSGKIVINPQFDSAFPFFDGLAAAQIGGKWGFIDMEGKIVINPQFEDAQPFVNGLAAVMISKQYGYVDKTGKIAINPQFDQAYPFSDEGLARVWTSGQTGFIDKEGKYVINPQFGGLGNDYQVGVIMAVTSEIQRISFSEGLAPVKVGDKDVAFINDTGKIIINPQFNFATPFYGGLALVIFDTNSPDGEMAWIDKEGKTVWRETKNVPKTYMNTSMSVSNEAANVSNTAANMSVNSSVPLPPSNSSAVSERIGRLTTDSNLRSDANKDSMSNGIHFKGAKLQILDETSFTQQSGELSTWYRVRITEYGCSVDTNLGCGKNSSNDLDEGWVNAKNVLLD